MSKKIKVYTGEIDEFVDWMSGIDELSGANATGRLPVSGKSIRDLLHNRLKAPIYFYYDENNSLYRLFSSEKAFQTWQSDEEKYADLELGNFVAPSPFTATLTGLSEETKYIRNGDNQNTELRFRWNIEGKNQSNYSDSVTLTYTFSNNGTQTIPIKYTHAQQNVVFDMTPYLSVGTNTVTVSLKGDVTNAVTSISFNVEVLDLKLSSTFSIYSPIEVSARKIDINYEVEGSALYGRTVDFYIDGNVNTFYQEHITSTEYTYNGLKTIATRLATGKHTLQMISYVTINNINYYSNLCYFEFVVEGYTDVNTKHITCSKSFEKNNDIYSSGEDIKLYGIQYEDFELDWGFYTSDPFNTSMPVEWRAYYKNLSGQWEESTITIVTAKQNTKTSKLIYIPVFYGQHYLRAYVNNQLIQEYNFYVYQNTNSIAETEGFIFKLTAKGRSNSEPAAHRTVWSYTYDDQINDEITYTTEFHDFLWNQNSGWNDNALVLSNGATADIHINPLDEDTVGLLTADQTNGFAFEIEFETFNIDDPSEVIIKMGNAESASIQITPNSAFITNTTGTTRLKTNFKEGEKVKLAFILNSSVSQDKKLLYIVNNGILERGILVPGENFNSPGEIHLNGVNTGLRIYSMRLYNKAISYNEAFGNFVLDSGNITELLTKNNVYDANGNISEVLCEQKLDTILITGPLDTVIGALDKRAEAKVTIQRICLSNPEYSFTIKNGRIRRHGQSTLNYPVPNFKIWSDSYQDSVMYDNNGAVIYKGRYSFKEGAIPCKKWVLQANYADSSGVHNGGLLRLMQSSWYEARIDSDYKLRTPPQQYTTSTGEFDGDGWKEKMNCDFPYTIRISADSLPCVVFWRADETSTFSFLGQYVMMDDKKSDYVYGERSIYNKADDPFRLKGDAPKKEQMECLWDNKNTLQIEILAVNTPYVNYTTTTGWENILESTTSGSSRSWMFNWENNFEAIYPEPDDLYNVGEPDVKDLNDTTIMKNKFQPFTDWIQWLVDCYQNYCATGNYDKFRLEAEYHLDLYKLAAYYIFVLRFGLVDSLQRNAQIKTYDGQHFWYEPWDMDIALGNKNTGGIAFDPPIDRDSQDPNNPGTYWISGKNGVKGTSNYTSCFLWDALEAWTTVKDEQGQMTMKGWIDNIVPAVSNALYAAGLSYNNVMKMFDEEYADHWCERMYNDSGHYKYIENGDGDYLQYLQGARTSHRHWWTKTSFDYWDAKWASGDFRTNSITIITNTTTSGQKIKITPSTATYFSFYNGTTGAIEATTPLTTKNVPVTFNMTSVLSTKDPRQIFGSLYIKELDISEVAQYLERLNLSGLYNDITGTNIETLNIGMGWQDMLNGKFNYKNITITNYKDLSKLSSLYVRGFRSVTSFISLVAPLSNLQNFYGAGSGITQFKASDIGNQFNVIELPDTISEISLKDSSWKSLKFYHTNIEEGTHWEGSGEYDPETGEEILIEVPNTRLNGTPLTHMPDALNKVEFLGNTGQNDCTRQFVLDWVQYMKQTNGFIGKTLTVEDANWHTIAGQGGLSYNDLMDIAEIPNLSLKGYIKLTDYNPTSDQLSNIMAKFGEGVFSLGSADLTIDYEQNAIVISAPSPCYTDDEGNIYLKEGSYYDSKGNLKTSVKLQASVFTLQAVNRIQKWGIAAYGSTNWGMSTQRVSINQNTGEVSAPESLLNARKVSIIVQDSTDPANARSQQMVLNIAKRQYPTTIGIALDSVRIVDNEFQIGTNTDFTFYPKFFDATGAQKQFDGTIESYAWSFSGHNDMISLKEGDDGTGATCSINVHDLQAYAVHAQVKLVIKYVNTYTVTATFGIQLMESIPVLQNDAFGNAELFKVVSQIHDASGNLLYPPQGSSYYSDDFAQYTGKFDLSQYEIDQSALPEPYYHKDRVYRLRSTLTRDSNNLLLFLTNTTELDISNFPELNEVIFNDARYDDGTEIGTPLPEALFDDWTAYWFKSIKMTNLPKLPEVNFDVIEYLEDINISDNILLSSVAFNQNKMLKKVVTARCSALQTVDMSLNTDAVAEIDLRESNANLKTAYGTKISKIHYGSPSEVQINAPVTLKKTDIDFESYENLQSIILSDLADGKTITELAELINLIDE